MNGLYLFTLLAVAVFGQNISKVILWEDHSQGDPEFSMRSQVQMKKKLQEMGSFEFVEDDCSLHILPPHSVLFKYKQLMNELPEEIGQLANLEKLSLATNNLSALPKEIGLLSNL